MSKGSNAKRISDVYPSQSLSWPLCMVLALIVGTGHDKLFLWTAYRMLLEVLWFTVSWGSGLDSLCEDSFMGQPCRLPLWIPGCPCHKAQSLREVTNRITTSSTIKKNFSAVRLIDGQFLGQVIKSRYVVNAVFIHHAYQLGIYHL